MTAYEEEFGGTEVTLKFAEEEYLDPFEVSNFIYQFKLAYNVILDSKHLDEIYFEIDETYTKEDLSGDVQHQIPKIRDVLIRETPSGWGKYHLARKESVGNLPPLKIRRIKKESPFEIALLGLGTLIILLSAICEADVEMEILKGKFKISFDKTLGEGLKDLKEAFNEDD